MKLVRITFLGLVAFIGALAAATAEAAQPAHHRELCVGRGSGCYKTVQAAVDAARSGDTVRIGRGTFAGGVRIRASIHARRSGRALDHDSRGRAGADDRRFRSGDGAVGVDHRSRGHRRSDPFERSVKGRRRKDRRVGAGRRDRGATGPWLLRRRDGDDPRQRHHAQPGRPQRDRPLGTPVRQRLPVRARRRWRDRQLGQHDPHQHRRQRQPRRRPDHKRRRRGRDLHPAGPPHAAPQRRDPEPGRCLAPVRSIRRGRRGQYREHPVLPAATATDLHPDHRRQPHHRERGDAG